MAEQERDEKGRFTSTGEGGDKGFSGKLEKGMKVAGDWRDASSLAHEASSKAISSKSTEDHRHAAIYHREAAEQNRIAAEHERDNPDRSKAGREKYASSHEDTAAYHERKATTHEQAVRSGSYRDPDAIRLKLGVQGARDNPVQRHSLKDWAEKKTR